jgi:6-pyruvoyltetrahydropterin/6-carboxytetrahydropterin synthase
MFELEKTFNFEAGHVLKHHDGQCKDPHGHSYRMTIHVRSDKMIQQGPKTNMVMDFADISHLVKPMINEYLEHKWLNDTLQTDSPTTEFIAKWVYEYLAPHLPGLYAVTLQETSTSKVKYTPLIP